MYIHVYGVQNLDAIGYMSHACANNSALAYACIYMLNNANEIKCDNISTLIQHMANEYTNNIDKHILALYKYFNTTPDGRALFSYNTDNKSFIAVNNVSIIRLYVEGAAYSDTLTRVQELQVMGVKLDSFNEVLYEYILPWRNLRSDTQMLILSQNHVLFVFLTCLCIIAHSANAD